MTKIALFANGEVGLNIIRFLKSSGEDIAVVHLAGNDEDLDGSIRTEAEDAGSQIYSGNILKDESACDEFSKMHFDFLITVYWPWLLPEGIFGKAEKTINFHPAYLPVNRGWYPHVHSIIDGSKSGVTLHAIDANADTGPIWCRKEVTINIEDTALDASKKLQSEIQSLFFDNWEKIKTGQIEAVAQEDGDGNYHKKSEIENLDLIDLSKSMTAREFINILRARSFGEKGFAYFEDGDDKVFIRVNLDRKVEKNG